MQGLVSHTPEFIDEFVKTCSARKLDADTTTLLLKQAQMSELYTRSPEFRYEFENTMTKRALFQTLGKGGDMLFKGLGKGIAGAARWMKGNPRKALGLGAGVGGAFGVNKMNEIARNADLRKLLFFQPSYLTFPGTASAASATPASGGGSSIFDYVNSINRGPATPAVGATPSTSPAKTPGTDFGPKSTVSSLKDQLAELTLRETNANNAIQAAASSLDPTQQAQANRARTELSRIRAQASLLKKMMGTVVDQTQADQTLMHQQSGEALTSADRLIPYYMKQQAKNWQYADPGERSQLPFYKRWFGPNEETSRLRAEDAGSMLQRLREMRQAAQTASGTQLL